MGSSAKKKKEKKKDFQKPKLRVGKARPKASNSTDTSFKSKAIVLSQQSLTTSAPSSSAQFSHQLSLLNSRSDTQRRDSLSYLTSAISSRPVGTSLHQPFSVILPKILPLFLDGSNGVRGQLLKLLHTLPPGDVEDHIDQILLYIRAGMTHLAADIRTSTMDILAWALSVAGDELVSCAGGWVKTLKCFLAMLNWSNDNKAPSWSSSKASFGKAGSEGKAFVKSLTVLGSLLQAGLAEGSSQAIIHHGWPFPLSHTYNHVLPSRSNCFAHLQLFGSLKDEENEKCEDRQDRQRIYLKRFETAVRRGLETAKREGGEIGRAASAAEKVITKGMEGFEDPEVF